MRRRYRRNRSVRFYRHLVRTGSAFPRLPRRFAPRNDTSGQHSHGNGAAQIESQYCRFAIGRACPAPTGPVRIERRIDKSAVPSRDCHGPLGASQCHRQGSAAWERCTPNRRHYCRFARRRGMPPPLQRASADSNGGRCTKSAMPSRDCHVASLLAMTRQGSAAMGTVRHTESAPTTAARTGLVVPRPYRASARFNGGWYKSAMPSRDCTAPLGPRNDTSKGMVHQCPPAVEFLYRRFTPAKGIAASVRQQSRQRLRRERRYKPRRSRYHFNGGRRMIHSSFFSIHYSLFLISSIPLRGMANHMTKRPEIPCLSCKFPQSRRICH